MQRLLPDVSYTLRSCLLHARLMVCSRIYGDTVSGMDTGALDMLHDTRNQDIGAVAYGINLDLLAHADIYQPGSDAPVRYRLMMPINSSISSSLNGDLHTLSAKYVGRTDQYRIAELVGCFFCLFCGEYGVHLRLSGFQHCSRISSNSSRSSAASTFSAACTKDRHTHFQ